MKRRSLPALASLRAFEVFARTGSMTLGAEELRVTHGAISRQVRALEEMLGTRLVVGPRHRLELTPAGRVLATALTSAFDLIAGSLPGAAPPAEELVVSCYGTLAMKWLIPRLPTFLKAHPTISVRIVESNAPVDFSYGDVHAAIRIEGADWPAGSRVSAFMPHFHGPVLSPSLYASLEDASEALLRLPRLSSQTFRSAWPSWAAKARVALPQATVEREFEHNSYMLEAAAAGLGVAVSPWAFASADIERQRLVAPLGFELVPERFVYVRPRLGDNDAAEAFGKWLRLEGGRAAQPPAAPTQGQPSLIYLREERGSI